MLVKTEQLLQKDADGKEVSRKYKTADTPYILTPKMKESVCNVHSADTLIDDAEDSGNTSPAADDNEGANTAGENNVSQSENAGATAGETEE